MFRVYVGNLPYRVRQEDLAQYFEDAGCAVAVTDDRKDTVIPMTEDRRSKGFGFVSFADEDSFKKALALDGQEMDGRALNVKEARPREDRRSDAPQTESTDAPASEEEVSEAAPE